MRKRTEHYDRTNNPYVDSFSASTDIPEDDYSEESGPDDVYPDWLACAESRAWYARQREQIEIFKK